MFAVNGPAGPTSRTERRVRDDRPTKEQLENQRKKREAFKAEFQGFEYAGLPLAKKTLAFLRYSRYYLTKLVQEHGGNLAREFKVTRVTHIVACNLSGAKADKLMKSCGKIKCVRPEWILQSVKEGRKLPEYEFLVYKDASTRVLSRAFNSLSGLAPP